MRAPRRSLTAHIVLDGVWLTACDPKTSHFVDPADVEYTGAALRALGSPLRWLLKLALVRLLARKEEAKIAKGICAHFASRKRAIKEVIRESEPEYLVVLGAGLDGLAYEFANRCKVAEVDLPGTQDEKKVLLSQLPSRPVELVQGDCSSPAFTMPPTRARRENTIVVAEGLLMYLEPTAVRNVLNQAAQEADTMLATFMRLDEKGLPAFSGHEKEVERVLKKAREPFKWGLQPDQIIDFFRSCGWRVERVLGASDPDLPLLTVVEGMIPGEWIAHLSARSDFE